jgi:PIN domain nuclease of toxin-antitoxin system
MRLLVDTHLLIWAAADDPRIPSNARTMMGGDDVELLFSPASIWEVAIKCGLGRADFRVDPRLLRRGLLDNGYGELPVTSAHAVAVSDLPAIHKDPFDRLLVAQAQIEGILLLTSDATVARYPGPVRLV